MKNDTNNIPAASVYQTGPAPAPVLDEQQQQRILEELEELRQVFPQVYARAAHDANAIPPEVWEQVRQGKNLTDAYARYVATQSMQMQPVHGMQGMQPVQTAQTTPFPQSNPQNFRSTGSMRSAGGNTGLTDPFLRGFLG